MGAVFEAEDRALRRIVVLKVLRAGRRHSVAASRRLLAEARALARLNHPNVVQVFDQGDDPRYGPFVVMEMLTGTDLARRLRLGGPWALVDGWMLIRQLCAGLEAAHARGILHRDLKPSNLFLAETGTGWHLKILDFGLARLDGAAQGTEPSDLLGTLAYMPPERWASATAGDERADVYGAAAVIYEVLRGAPAFRASRRAELMLAVRHDNPEPLDRFRSDLPRALVDAVTVALAKDPTNRFPTVNAFARALGIAGPVTETPGVSAPEPAFSGTPRYAVKALVSRTPTSEVYLARDKVRRRRVAIKRVSTRDAEATDRLKRERRVLAALRHPNILRTVDAWEADGALYVVSDWVDGLDILSQIRMEPTSLRQAFAGLGAALAALHARGLVHGDIKPSNVLVRSDGRPILIDFGLSRSVRRAGPATVAGTSAYVAPELWDGASTPAGDLYAAGVLLWQATHDGELPPQSAVGQLSVDGPTTSVSRRRKSAASSLREGRNYLNRLAAQLLSPDPARRPPGSMLAGLAREGGELSGDEADRYEATRDEPVLLGRSEALAQLTEAAHRAWREGPCVVWLSGASGIGKTALLDRMRREYENDPMTLVLSAYARDAVGVPFPALDAAVDELVAWMKSLPDATCAALLPRGARWLVQLFPALRRVPILSAYAADSSAVSAQPHARARAFAALRELICRLSDRQRLLLLLDDAQWIDPDSAALLTHLLDGSEPPRLLVVATVRLASAEVPALPAAFERPLPGHHEHLHLAPLGEDDAVALLSERWGGVSPLDGKRARALAKATGGVPFLLELVASASAVPAVRRARHEDDFTRLIHARVGLLPRWAREGLIFLCLSPQPLSVAFLLAVLKKRAASVFDPLLESHLVRVSTPRQAGTAVLLEPVHGRLAEALRRRLTPAERRRRHLRLAETLRQVPETPPQQVIEQLAAAGEHGAAAELALEAARLAVRQLAFDRAVSLFELALIHGSFPVKEGAQIHGQLASALEEAGQRRRAGEVLLRGAAGLPDGTLRRQMEEHAGIDLLSGGDVARGLSVLAPALGRHDLALPRTTETALAEIHGAFGALLSRGLDVPWLDRSDVLAAADDLRSAPRDPSSGGAKLKKPPKFQTSWARVDLALAVAQGLEHIDVRAVLYAARALHAALDAGHVARLQRAAAVFVTGTAVSLPTPLSRPAFELCRRLTRDDDPFALGLLYAAEAQIAHSEGQFMSAEACFERAEQSFVRSWTGPTRELHAVRDVAVFMQYAHKGDFRTHLERTSAWLVEAEASDDLFHASMLRVAHAIVWIAHDQPEKAARELERSRHTTTGVAGVLQVVEALYGDIVARYQQDEHVLDDPPPSRAAGLASPAAGTPFLRGYLVLQEVWKTLRKMARAQASAVAGTAALAAFGADAVPVRDALGSLRLTGLGLWEAVADALEANLAFLEEQLGVQGQQGEAGRLLHRAEQSFRRLNMPCLAACARKRRGQLLTGELARRLETEGDAELRGLGVVAPDRWAVAYWSMFPAPTVAR